MEREKERKIESSSETNRDRDGASEGMKSESEKSARWRRAGWRIRRGPSVPREGGYVPRRKERLRKRNSDARRAENAPIYESGMKMRGGTRARERRPREYGVDAGEQARGNRGGEWGNGDEKERRYARKERRNDIERERVRGTARVKAGGRERERARVGVTGGGSETAAYVF